MQVKQLIISIHDRDMATVSWIMLDADANIISEPKTCLLAEIPPIDSSFKVIVLIPTTDILILPVTLPNMPASHRGEAALFTLEENLIDEIQDLHAAILETNELHQYYALIINKNLLKNWLDKLHSAHIMPAIMVPDVFALPKNENEWTIAINHETVWLKISDELGIAIDANLIQPVLTDLILNEKITVSPFTIYNFTKHDVANDFAFLGQKVDVIDDSEKSFFADILLNIDPDRLSANLLQGEFEPQAQYKSQRKRWRFTSIMAVLLLSLILISVTTQWIYLNYQDNLLQQQIAILYHKVFPQATTIISPKFRIQEELNKQAHALSQSGFLYLLALAGQSINNSAGISIQNLNYSSNTLTISVQANSTQSLDQVAAELHKQAINYKQTNTQSSGSIITADFILSRTDS